MMSPHNTDLGSSLLRNSLTRLCSKLENRAELEMVKLDNLINSADGNTEIPQERISTLINLKENLDHVLYYAKTNAIEDIVLAYGHLKNGNKDSVVLLNEEQIVFFIQRQRYRGETFAEEIASYLAKSFNTFAPLNILRRELDDMSPIDFGPLKIGLSEEVAVIDSAFTQGNITVFDDLIKCINVSKKVTTKWYTDPCYHVITEAIAEYDFGSFFYLYPRIDNSERIAIIKESDAITNSIIETYNKLIDSGLDSEALYKSIISNGTTNFTELSPDLAAIREQIQALRDKSDSKVYSAYNKIVELLKASDDGKVIEVPKSRIGELTNSDRVLRPPRFIGEKGERAFRILFDNLNKVCIEETTYENFAGLFRCLPSGQEPTSYSKIKWIAKNGVRSLQCFLEALYRPANNIHADLNKQALSRIFVVDPNKELKLSNNPLYCWGKNKPIIFENSQEKDIMAFLDIINYALNKA